MKNLLEKIKSSVLKEKHLYIVSTFTFLLIYLSTFTKGYGYFIDEFYYIACADNPALGYVDHPPLAPLLLTVFKFFFGDSLYAIRILPALAIAAAVFFTGILTKEIGGNKFAQLLAACSIAAMPVTMAFGGFYSMNAFEPLFAVLLLLIIVKMINSGNLKLWMYAGIVIGLGVMNKHTFVIFILALIIALAVSGKWKLLFNKWFVYGGIISALIFLPNIIWQIINDFPSLEFYRNISLYKNVYTPPIDFIMGQVMQMSPTTVPFWLAGTFYFLFSKRYKEFRFLSILFAGLFLFMMLSGTSRADRLIFAYPAAFAGGALFFANIINRYNAIWLKSVIIIFLFIGLVISLPLILPYFNYETVKEYTEFIGINTEIEKGKKPPLPQILADRIGWKEKVNLVVNAYNSLSEQDRKQTIVAARNYGNAGAIELYGKDYNIPPLPVRIIITTCGVKED
ncbi:MAG TPA: glycosyltransferase family 39 protein [Ignavibacteriaceae bacterium]|nr:glycosyltransferase family 39 protein [Ignavibacteriaceae bacterium]